ncbi:MAG: radical SAM protein [Candidatus Zixiibacteriota bacterium]
MSKDEVIGDLDITLERGNGLKPSDYNFSFIADDGSYLFFNALSGAFARVDSQRGEIVKELLKNPASFECQSDDDKKLLDSAIKGGYVIPETVNELDILKTISSIGRFSSDKLHLTIMPTLACNLRCVYCYEEHPPQMMNRTTQDAIIAWVTSKMDTIRQLSIGWFGGEPLLNFKAMKYMSEQFQKICDRNGVKYKSSISTNAELLKPRFADHMKNMSIKYFQITVDGPPDIHNQMRIRKDGKGTYNTIIDNILYLYRIMPDANILLRVNVNESTIEHIPRFFDGLPDIIRRKADMYLAEIYQCTSFISEDPNRKNTSIGADNNIDTSRLSPMRQKMLEMALKGAEYRRKESPEKVTTRYQMYPKPGYCEAEYANNFVVNPEGSLFKCTVSFQNDLKVGQVHADGTATFNLSKLAIWLSKNIFENEKCVACKMLPLCMGGCQSARLKNPTADGCPVAVSPNEMEPMLKLLYKEGIYKTSCSPE